MRFARRRVRRWFAWRPVFVDDLDQWVWWERVWKVSTFVLCHYYHDEQQARRAAKFWAPRRY